MKVGVGARHKHRAEIRHTGRQLWEEVGFNDMEGRGPNDQPGFHLPSLCWASQAASKVCYPCGHVTMFGPPWKRGVETGGTQFRRWLLNTPSCLVSPSTEGGLCPLLLELSITRLTGISKVLALAGRLQFCEPEKGCHRRSRSGRFWLVLLGKVFSRARELAEPLKGQRRQLSR